jgi:hypothetical protein
MLGVNRIVVGAAVPNPTGNPKLEPEAEHEYRRHLVDECLKLLSTDVEGPTTVVA